MNKIILVGVLSGICLLSPTNLLAKSEVYNASDRIIGIYFQASDCTGARTQSLSDCSTAPETGAVGLVCQESTIAPGEQAEYKFDRDASGREIIAAWCEGTNEVEARVEKLGNSGDKHKCVVLRDTSTSAQIDLKLRCGYSKKAFKSIKKRPLLKPGN